MKKILLLSDLNKKKPKKFIKRKKDPYFKDVMESSDIVYLDKKHINKKLRHECKRLIKEFID